LKLPPFSSQKCHSAGGRGVPEFVLDWNRNIYVTLEPKLNLKPYDNPFWGFNNGIKNKKSTRNQEQEIKKRIT
jgi:hypothetical protein